MTLNRRTFNDVIRLSATGGSGAGDKWWFARGIGLIKFDDGKIREQYSHLADPYEVNVRLPCNGKCM